MKWNEAKIRYDKLGPKVVENLKKRHFDAYYVSTREEAIEKFFEIVPKDHVVSWGGTCTVDELELKPMLREKGYAVIDRDEAKNMEERMEIMRKALLCDTFVMSSNAISEDGQLFNIDGNGNRVAAMCFGPKSGENLRRRGGPCQNLCGTHARPVLPRHPDPLHGERQLCGLHFPRLRLCVSGDNKGFPSCRQGESDPGGRRPWFLMEEKDVYFQKIAGKETGGAHP